MGDAPLAVWLHDSHRDTFISPPGLITALGSKSSKSDQNTGELGGFHGCIFFFDFYFACSAGSHADVAQPHGQSAHCHTRVTSAQQLAPPHPLTIIHPPVHDSLRHGAAFSQGPCGGRRLATRQVARQMRSSQKVDHAKVSVWPGQAPLTRCLLD